MDMRPFLQQLRELEQSPELERVYRNAAADVVSAGVEQEDSVFDPEFLELAEDERSAFLTYQAEQLAPVLRRAALAWALFESETVAEWRRRTDG